MGSISREATRRLVGCIDLTSLNDGQDDDVAALCAQAVTPHGPVAAVCSWPRHVAAMKTALGASPVKIAAVANFPRGEDDIETACAEARTAVADGAQEIDLVVPYKAWLAGDRDTTHRVVAAVREAVPNASLKTILESGAFGDDMESLAGIAATAIEAGADTLKTSTGKSGEGASLTAARCLLEAAKAAPRQVGFKASGGIRTVDQAAQYLALAEEIMGEGWATPASFRVGASRLLNELLAELER